jgi:hypothetical protein
MCKTLTHSPEAVREEHYFLVMAGVKEPEQIILCFRHLMLNFSVDVLENKIRIHETNISLPSLL